MKSFIGILFISFLASGMARAQEAPLFHSSFEEQAFASGDPIQILLASDDQVDHNKYSAYRDEIEQLVLKLKNKHRGDKSIALIEKAFYYTHRKSLDWYENYVTLSDLLQDGKYDCLTGTALYAIILSELGVDYSIYEFDFHVFLVASVNGDSVLLESTDPYYGFVKRSDEISEHINQYLTGEVSPQNSNAPVGSNGHQYSSHINNRITLNELAGLQYFNLAINAFNQGQLELASSLLNKANLLYPSHRIKEIQKVFANR